MVFDRYTSTQKSPVIVAKNKIAADARTYRCREESGPGFQCTIVDAASSEKIGKKGSIAAGEKRQYVAAVHKIDSHCDNPTGKGIQPGRLLFFFRIHRQIATFPVY